MSIYYEDCMTCKNFGNCGCDDLREREYLHREGKDCYESKISLNDCIVDYNTIQIRVPKEIAKIKMCGGALTFTIDDTMQFEMPTKEQCENLKKTFGIEVELIENN